MNPGSRSISKAWWLNAGLAAAVIALASFIYLRKGSEAPDGYALAAFKPGEVSSIRIERAGAAPVVLERKLDAWFITAPFAGRADPMQVERVLEIGGARSANRFAPTDLARYELDSPQVRLTVGGQRFDFGMVNPVSHEQYVLTGNAVHAVSLRYGAALPASPGDLLDKRLLGAAESPVRIEHKEYTVSRQDGKWALAPPGGDLSQDDYQRWVDGWRHASAVRVAPYVKGIPAGEIGLQFQAGGKLTLAILAREPELALLRPDENLVYYFLRGHARRLLAPPGTSQK